MNQQVRRSPDSRFLATLASVTLVGPFAIYLFLPAMPEVKAAFGISDAVAGLSFSVSLFVMAFITLAYGTLSDRYGRRPALLTGLVLFSVGSAISAMATSATTLIFGRLVQAVGAACGATLGRAIARDAYKTDRLIGVIGYLSMAYALGPTIAPLLGGLLVDSAGWRSIFVAALLSGATMTIAAYAVLYETRPELPKEQRQFQFLSFLTPLLHLRFAGFVLQAGFASGTIFALAAASSFLMNDYLGRSATEFGLYFLLLPAGLFLGTLVSTRLSQHVPMESMVLAGSIIAMAAAVVQAAVILTGYLTPLIIFVPGFFLTLAQGIALPNAQVGAMRTMPDRAGTAAGLGVFFPLFLGATFSQIYASFTDNTPLPMVATVSMGATLTLIAGVVPFLLRRRPYPKPQPA